MSYQSDWIYYKQPIKFLVFVADTCNMIFLFVSLKWYLDIFVFHGQAVAIKKLTVVHTVRINYQTRSQFSGTSRKMFGPIFSYVFRGIFTFRIDGNC